MGVVLVQNTNATTTTLPWVVVGGHTSTTTRSLLNHWNLSSMSFAKWISKTNVCRAQVVEKALFWNFYTSSWKARSVRSVRPSNKTCFSIVANHRCHETMVFRSTIQQRYIPTTKCPKKFRKSLHLTAIKVNMKKKRRKKETKQGQIPTRRQHIPRRPRRPQQQSISGFLPSNISGARYHNVMTLGDNFA